MSLDNCSRAMARKITKERITLVTPTPSDQPVLAPMYRLVALRTPPSMNPVTAARKVSCGILPRNTVSSHQ